ncbi:Hypothetical predicted protein, partial [Paramuricea clavata]
NANLGTKKKAIINMKNYDDECFKWAVTRALNPINIHPERISKELKKQSRKIDWEGIEFPTPLNNIRKFENNNSIGVNVFGLDGSHKANRSIRRSLGLSTKKERRRRPKRELRFIDSFKFMASSLDKLVKGLGKDDFKNLDLMLGRNTKEQRELLKQKGVYPYEYMDGFERLKETSLPPKEKFFSRLNNENISDTDYERASDVMENFRKVSGFQEGTLEFNGSTGVQSTDHPNSFRTTKYSRLSPANICLPRTQRLLRVLFQVYSNTRTCFGENLSDEVYSHNNLVHGNSKSMLGCIVVILSLTPERLILTPRVRKEL